MAVGSVECLLGKLIVVMCLMWGSCVNAGVVTLSNGDEIQGVLKGIYGDAVQWDSPVLGHLSIPKDQIGNLSASELVKIRGTKEPCVVVRLYGSNVVFECENGQVLAFPFMSMEHVVPYSGYVQANHSYNGSLKASGWQQMGNTEAKFWEVISSVTYRHLDLRHVVSVTLDGQRNETQADDGTPVQTRNRHRLGRYTLDWFFKPQVYWSNQLSAEEDGNRNIQEEYILGSGLGYQFWESTVSALSLALGLDYSRTYLNNNPLPSEPEKVTSGRLVTQYRYKFGNGLALYHNNELVRALESPAPGNATRWRTRTDTGLQFPIGFGVSAEFSVKWDFVNYATDLDSNASREDRVYRVGVNYAW